ncbi:LLM class flavin-dependent oxidoreductase [Candidatus Bathyarchaeota archaeon]|nr:LLM class flavin-dependent oxidoreductase [Candidatus Bathyarchaeota archaeon]
MEDEELSTGLNLGITTSYPIKLGVYMASTADKYNLGSIWIRDGMDDPRDIYTYASLVLTSSKRVAAGIEASPFHYNISTIARSSATLVELHGERLKLGLGVGELGIAGITGVTPTHVMDGLRDAVGALRVIFKGGAVSLDTPYFKLDGYSLWSSFRIPIYLWVRNPGFLRSAFNVADGVILSGPKPFLEEASRLFRDVEISRSLKLLGWIPTAVLYEKESDIPDSAAEVVAAAAADTPNGVLEASGIDLGKVELVRRGLLLRRWDRVVKLVDEELMDLFLFHGPPADLIKRLLGWARRNGMDEVVLGPPYGLDPEKSIGEAVSAWMDSNSP